MKSGVNGARPHPVFQGRDEDPVLAVPQTKGDFKSILDKF